MSGDNNSNNDDKSGGRTLGGGAAEPLPAEWASRSSNVPRVGRVGAPSSGASRTPAPTSSGRIASLRDLASSGSAPRGPRIPSSHTDDDDSGGDDDPANAEGESWFAGGERSGINVENPERPSGPSGSNSVVKDILRKAAQAPRPAEEEAKRSAFFGAGNTLGSDEIPSSSIPDPNARTADEEEDTAIRNLTFWKDGFSIEDGPLMEYENEQNKLILAAINSGNAPPSILNVRVGQPVELRVARRVNETYQPPLKRANPFAGTGNRLGSVVPNVSSSSTSNTLPGSFPSGPPPSSSFDDSRVNSITTRFEVDQSRPTTSVQIRLADGTRIVSRMNLTHTVGDIRNFINASRPAHESQPYTIGTTFPNRTLEDDNLTIEAAGLLNSVIVQRWV